MTDIFADILKNEEIFVSGTLDGRLCVWNVIEGKIILEIPLDIEFVTSIALSHDGSTALVGSYEGLCTVIEFHGTPPKSFKVKGRKVHSKKGKKITGIQFSSDLNRVRKINFF